MSITMSCPRCDAVIHAENEDDLVARIQLHVHEDHGLGHTLPTRHILAHLRRAGTPSGSGAGDGSPGPQRSQPPR